MQGIVSRFHTLLLSVTVATTAVAYLRVPGDHVFAAHWQGGDADWLWPSGPTLAVAPLLQLAFMAIFFGLGRLLTRNHLARTQHIFAPALTLLMLTVAACQLGLLLAGIGSDLDLFRVIGVGLAITLAGLGVVLFEAQRHTYAGLRLPWPIATDRAWRWAHRVAGAGYVAAGLGLMALAWMDAGIGMLSLGFALALLLPPLPAAAVSWLLRRH